MVKAIGLSAALRFHPHTAASFRAQHCTTISIFVSRIQTQSNQIPRDIASISSRNSSQLCFDHPIVNTDKFNPFDLIIALFLLKSNRTPLEAACQPAQVHQCLSGIATFVIDRHAIDFPNSHATPRRIESLSSQLLPRSQSAPIQIRDRNSFLNQTLHQQQFSLWFTKITRVNNHRTASRHQPLEQISLGIRSRFPPQQGRQIGDCQCGYDTADPFQSLFGTPERNVLATNQIATAALMNRTISSDLSLYARIFPRRRTQSNNPAGISSDNGVSYSRTS